METYTSFINNWKRAKEVIKTTSQAKPAFARFLEVQLIIVFLINFIFIMEFQEIYLSLLVALFMN